jgi:hypothetical protein
MIFNVTILQATMTLDGQNAETMSFERFKCRFALL